MDFQQNKEIYPNLMFITVGDDRVRPEHEVLNGVIKPLFKEQLICFVRFRQCIQRFVRT